jgi:hypothetical protein
VFSLYRDAQLIVAVAPIILKSANKEAVFRSVRKIAKSDRFVMSACQHETIQLQLDGFLRNLILEVFYSENMSRKLSLIKN